MVKLTQLLAIVLIFSKASLAMPILDIDTTGRLLGASNIDVGGTSYNVRFGGGNCVDTFSGCDDQSDFTFTTEESAIAASQALLNQVFVGIFDTDTNSIGACRFTNRCNVLTPWSLRGNSTTQLVNRVVAFNDRVEIRDVVRVGANSILTNVQPGLNTGGFVQNNWGIWSLSSADPTVSVSEPGSIALVLLGIVGLLVKSSCARRQASDLSF